MILKSSGPDKSQLTIFRTTLSGPTRIPFGVNVGAPGRTDPNSMELAGPDVTMVAGRECRPVVVHCDDHRTGHDLEDQIARVKMDRVSEVGIVVTNDNAPEPMFPVFSYDPIFG